MPRTCAFDRSPLDIGPNIKKSMPKNPKMPPIMRLDFNFSLKIINPARRVRKGLAVEINDAFMAVESRIP